ncbi:MAG: hypothetical protein K0R17_3313 [Rariglobus sp.]|jgi:1-acyl-sn-glycerol-3-phosphate acyltransferase|nr:hypothetical protein [Rariglobus sp.]
MMATLWNNVRGARRLTALLAVIGWSGAAYVVQAAHRRDAAAKARWLQQACRRALRVLAVKVESRGEPVPGALIAANHLGYLDILVLAALTPVVFVSKKEVRAWPVFGWFAEKAGTRFIDRTRRGDVSHVGAGAGSVVAEGLGLVIFLEGTSTDGREVLPFKSSLLEPAVLGGWRVVPAGLFYDVPPGRSAAREVCWWGDMTLLPHLWNLMTVPWVRAHVAWGTPIRAGDWSRKLLARELRQEVLALTIKTPHTDFNKWRE